MNLAGAARRRGDLAEARRNLERASEIYRSARDRTGLVSTALAIGGVVREAGELQEASRQYRSALALSLEIGWDRGTVSALEGIREVALDRGDASEAELYAGQIQDIKRLMAPDTDPPAG